MGIRFFCPQCDRRLHVKDFLAGKKGICPHCDESIVIPRESTHSKDSLADEASAESTGDGNKKASVAPAKSASAKSSKSTSAPADVTTDGDSQVSGPASVSKMPVAVPPASPETDLGELDPIAIGPHLIWYVRPPSGGQYGPAEGDVMRQWLNEGRVTAESLVWQEGWDEWRSAIEVFPEIGPATPETGAQPVVENSVTVVESPREQVSVVSSSEPVEVDETKMKMLEYRLKRSKGKGKEIAIVAVLGLVCLLLIAVLGLVVTKQF